METIEQIYRHDSKVPVILITGAGTSDTAIEAMKVGAYGYLLKPLDYVKVRALVERAIEVGRSMHVPVHLPERSSEQIGQTDVFIGRCPAMQGVYKAIGRVASHDASVLIRGDTGTGKELVGAGNLSSQPAGVGALFGGQHCGRPRNAAGKRTVWPHVDKSASPAQIAFGKKPGAL